MKVLVIMGSPRKGATYRATEQIKEVLQSRGTVDFEYLMLNDVDLSHCRGCFICFVKGEEHCPIKDEGQSIEKKMHDADAVIFASPVYGMNVSGLMKVFIDRFSYIFHRPRFFDKKAFLLATTGAVGLKEVLGYLRLVASTWGFDVVAEAGLITPPAGIPQPASQKLDNDRILQKATEKFHQSLMSGKRSSPSLQDVIVFRAQRAAFEEMGSYSPVDYAYWKEHGWFDRGMRFYVQVPVNPLYDAIGTVVEFVLRRRARKVFQEALKENVGR